MSNTDLVSAYLEDQLSIGEKQAFEEQLGTSTELQKELGFQQEVVSGIKEARKAQLKSMLNNVAVPAASSGGNAALGKIAAGIGILGLAALGWYFLSGESQVQTSQPESEQVAVEQTVSENNELEATTTSETEELESESENVEAASEIEPTQEEVTEVPVIKQKEVIAQSGTQPEVNKTVKPAAKPEIHTPSVTDFESVEETTDSLLLPGMEIASGSLETIHALNVEIDNTRRKYSFHYQFKDGSLFLYGDFEKDLYEILEFNGTQGKNLFLYYKDSYYTLDRTQNEIKALALVKDGSLIDNLRKARQN